MKTEIPIYLTTRALTRLTRVHRSTIARLIAQGEIAPAAFVEEGDMKRLPLFHPAIAVTISVLVDRAQPQPDIPPAICAGQ